MYWCMIHLDEAWYLLDTTFKCKLPRKSLAKQTCWGLCIYLFLSLDISICYIPKSCDLKNLFRLCIRRNHEEQIRHLLEKCDFPFLGFSNTVQCFEGIQCCLCEQTWSRCVWVKVPSDAWMIDFSVSDAERGGSFLDNNNGMEYHVDVSGSTSQSEPLNVVHVAVEMAPIAKVPSNFSSPVNLCSSFSSQEKSFSSDWNWWGGPNNKPGKLEACSIKHSLKSWQVSWTPEPYQI